jgi:hypothetical protein
VKTGESDNTYIRPPVASADPQLRYATRREQSTYVRGTVTVCWYEQSAAPDTDSHRLLAEQSRTVDTGRHEQSAALPNSHGMSAEQTPTAALLTLASTPLAVTSVLRYLVGIVLMLWLFRIRALFGSVVDMAENNLMVELDIVGEMCHDSGAG